MFLSDLIRPDINWTVCSRSDVLYGSGVQIFMGGVCGIYPDTDDTIEDYFVVDWTNYIEVPFLKFRIGDSFISHW